MVSDKLVITAVTSLPMLVGLAVIYKGYSSRKLASTMEDKDATPIGDLQPGDGLVEINGRARADGGLSTATMLDKEGVAVTTSVERRDTRDTSGEHGGQRVVWNTVHSDRSVHDFSIEDDTGSIPVEIPDDGELSVATRTITVGRDEAPPEPVRKFLEATDGVEADPHNIRRYNEGVIEDGESVYGLGEPVTGEDGQLVFSGDQRAGEYIVSDLSEEELAEQKAGGGLGAYILGGFFFLMGAGFTALIWLA